VASSDAGKAPGDSKMYMYLKNWPISVRAADDAYPGKHLMARPKNKVKKRDDCNAN